MRKSRIVDCGLFLTFFFLSFTNIPQEFQLKYLSAGFSNKLSWYPLFILFILYLYEKYKYRRSFNNFSGVTTNFENPFLKFTIVYLAFMLISIFHGLYNYPYYEFLNGAINSSNTPKALIILNNYGINMSLKLFAQLWMVARLIFAIIYTLGFSYILYYFINNKGWDKSVSLFKKGIYFSLFVIFSYSSIELFYLLGNQTATDILVKITPFFYDVNVGGSWWPPLLWKNQLRSIFAEPSYFGIYASLVSPILWSNILEKKNKLFWLIVSGAFTFLIFTTQARTANLLFLGEIGLLIIFLIYYYGKKYLQELILILGMSVFSFFLAANFCAQINSQQNASYNYFRNNIASVIGTHKRSNSSRYAIIIGNIKLGMDYPILGVGYGLNSAYLPKYFPEKLVKNNKEIEKWIDNIYKNGILKSKIPNLGEYACKFSQTGLIGLTLVLFPWIFAIIKIFSKIRKIQGRNKINAIGLYIALIAAAVGGLGDNMRVSYIYWILLAFGYTIIKFENGKINNIKKKLE